MGNLLTSITIPGRTHCACGYPLLVNAIIEDAELRNSEEVIQEQSTTFDMSFAFSSWHLDYFDSTDVERTTPLRFCPGCKIPLMQLAKKQGAQ